jgi:hypothetical protein
VLLGLLLLGVGLMVLTAAVWTADLGFFLIGGAIAGAGAGTAFKGTVSTVLSLAAPQQRGESLTGLFLAAYLGLSIPVLGLGLGVQTIPVRYAVLAFVCVLLAAVVLVGRWFLTRLPAEPDRQPTEA